MATGDVTVYGPYSQDNISAVKTDLEAGSVAVADTIFVSPSTNGSFYVFVLEA